jgi:hypothetical protein
VSFRSCPRLLGAWTELDTESPSRAGWAYSHSASRQPNFEFSISQSSRTTTADYDGLDKANKHTPSYRLRRHSICIYLAKPRHPVQKCHISIKSRKEIPLGFRDVPVFSQHPDPLSCFSFIFFNAVQYTHEILPPSFMEHKLQSVFYMTPVAGIPRQHVAKEQALASYRYFVPNVQLPMV